jgi:chromate transporter
MSKEQSVWNEPSQTEKKKRLREVAFVFLKLGTIAFGGPAAHIAMMNEEIVQKRKWVNQETFLDLLGAANLIPGPNSTELAIHLGYRRAGWGGLLLAGACFILPAMLIVLAFAVAYKAYGSLPETSSILYGIKPVIMAIVLQALWGLGRQALKNRETIIIGITVVLLSLFGVHEIFLLVLAGLAALLWQQREKLRGRLFSLAPGAPMLSAFSAPYQHHIEPGSLMKLFLLFLKTGSVLYGSGYVLLAFLQTDFVDRWAVLTPQQLLDAVAVGQFTPGPVFTTATFIGYLIAGTPGAILSTVGIFLPAFIFVALVTPWIPRLRQSPWTSSLLDGVNVASLALMAVVTVRLGFSAVVDPFTGIIAAISLLFVFRLKVNSAWLVLAGGLAGLLHSYLP